MFQNTVSSTSPLRFGGITLLVSFVLFFATAAPTQGAQVITFVPDIAGGYPESIAWNEHSGAFLVSSLRGGQIGLVYEDGRYRRFAVGRSQITTSGIVVDAVRNRVLVCNEDVGIALKSSPGTRNRVAQVLEFDLDTGALQHIYDFSPLSKGSTLANDLTIDAQGNVYVTDSFQPQIYKIDQATKAVSILVRSERLMPVTTTAASGAKPYLNGIVYHPDGYLIAGDYSRGLLWKVALDGTHALSEIKLPQRLKGPDGLRLKSPDTLVVVQSFPGAGRGMSGDVTLLSSSDGWASARITAVATPPGLDGPTAAAVKDGEVWVVNSRYPRLFADTANADRTREFSLVKVAFSDGQNVTGSP